LSLFFDTKFYGVSGTKEWRDREEGEKQQVGRKSISRHFNLTNF
jgi:hypothetical protein